MDVVKGSGEEEGTQEEGRNKRAIRVPISPLSLSGSGLTTVERKKSMLKF